MTPSASPADTLVEPAYRSSPEYTTTFGPEVADLCDLVGFGPDPQQRLGLDLLYSQRGGRHAAMSATVVAPRQNLKTGLLKQKALGDLYLMEEEHIVWSAHVFDTARRAFMELKTLIEGSEYLSRRTAHIYEGTGNEAIVTTAGCRLEFKARTNTGSRGLAAPNLFMDEAFSLKGPAMASLLPLILAQPDPHVIYASSGGLVESDFLRSLRDRGRAADPSMTYLEWCDDLPGECQRRDCSHEWGKVVGCKLDDVARWYRAMPALGGRVTIEAVQLLRRDLPADDFARECLGYWDDPEDSSLIGIPISAWSLRAGASGRPSGPVAFALSAAWPDAEMGSIAIVGRNGTDVYAQVVEHRPGTSWMPARMRELALKHKPAAVVLDDKDPAACEKTALVTALEGTGVELTSITTTEVTQAFGMITAAVMGDAPYLWHYNQPELNNAVESARKREVGDAHTWARKGPDDISPVVAVTDALYGLATHKPLAPFVLVGK